jgi:hypothetical protein
LADVKCAHCGQPHAEGTKFCPQTGKQIGPPSAAKATMIMFQSGGKLPGAPDPVPNGAGPPRATTPASTPVRATPANVRVPTPGQVRVNTPPGTPPATPGTAPPRTSSPATGNPALSERLSRMTPGVGVRVPTVPAPPVAVDNVPPPVAPAPPAGDSSGPRRPSQPGQPIPDWVPDPDAVSFTSAVFPAVGAPEKGALDILKDAFKLYRRHARDFLMTAAVLFIPGAIVSSLALALITAPLRASAAGLEAAMRNDPAAATALAGAAVGSAVAALLGMLGWAVVALIVYGIVVPLTLGALTVAVADRALGGEAQPLDYWRRLLTHLPRLLGALVPAALLCMVGYFFLVLPGIVLSFLFVFVPAVVLVEKQSGTAALKRSARLVRADWIRVAVVLITFGILNLVAHFLGGLFIPSSAFFLGRLVGDLLTLVLLPLPVLAAVLVYLDLRRKTEGLDKDALRAELEALRATREDEIG